MLVKPFLVVSVCLTRETRTTFRRYKLISNSVSRYPTSMQWWPCEHQLHAEPCRQAYDRMV